MPDDMLKSVFCQQIMDNLFDGVYCIGLDKKITYMNKAAEEICGYTEEEVKGKVCGCQILVHTNDAGEELCDTQCPFEHALNGISIREAQVQLHHKEGYRLPIITRSIPLLDAQGCIAGALQVFKTNANRARFVEKIKELQQEALYDGLSKVANRRYGEKFLQSRLQKLTNHPEYSLGVALFDIDSFKAINDNYGHNIGDRVIHMTAQTIANNLRPDDMICRWGGEEFLVILEGINNVDGAFAVADRLRILVAKSFLSIPVREKSSMLAVTVSGGATLARPGETPDTIFKRIDRLLYESKANNKNCVTVG